MFAGVLTPLNNPIGGGQIGPTTSFMNGVSKIDAPASNTTGALAPL
jgi:hypothetical protein